jgi:hypothetical protein
MAFGRKMDNDIYVELLDDHFDLLVIPDIAPLKIIFPSAELLFYFGQIKKVSSIGQLVIINDSTAKVSFIKNVSNKIGPDEACAAGHQDIR